MTWMQSGLTKVGPLHSVVSLVDRSFRFRLHDPFLNGARMAGIGRWGPGLSAMIHAAALQRPRSVAIIDDRGQLSYRELDRRSASLGGHLQSIGDGAIGILCRNHRGFVEAQIAAERSGRNVVLLNTALPAPQLQEVAARESLSTLITDNEFEELIESAGLTDMALFTEREDERGTDHWARGRSVCRSPRRRSELVLLTSGTTGPPKGARRRNRAPSASDLGMLDQIPYKMHDVTLVLPPLFHAWGLAQASIALSTGSTIVLHRSFDPAWAIEALAEHDVSIVAVVPLMLKRMLDVLDAADSEASADEIAPRLRAALCSGNVLGATLASRWMERFGPNLYNIYGSTETAIASIATPSDLIDSPGTVGSAPPGVTIAIIGEDDLPVKSGQIGRVFTANNLRFDGYTDSTDRERRGDLMATGDLGYMEKGRLFVDGREHDLIVTGGENVFPSEIEEVLEANPILLQAAVVGVPDDEFGQRIAAYVVPVAGMSKDAVRADVVAWVQERLAGYKTPREVHVVDALPMTTTGKVVRHALATLGQAEHV